eukprot:CAMPEP_0201485852 /NCGR_PEP_ID=MMETSP0151_2-20130828/9947_1 /ASSEMBLY_ACC=CAM_ASM_000257 /TAXON_ID=200890 /ORGANISM="Paramoeba atlantica, Strain 621/1 / CCAP 1560/9" /LENGTH=81 /DNA_ID=CAMNT_0047870175 /DNA_START=223 /DNA_END=468 /DNA_ORIENTATION=-
MTQNDGCKNRETENNTFRYTVDIFDTEGNENASCCAKNCGDDDRRRNEGNFIEKICPKQKQEIHEIEYQREERKLKISFPD